MKKHLRISNLWWLTKRIMCLILFLHLFALSASADNEPFDFGKKDSKWYYENKGKDKETIKHIYITSVKDTVINYFVHNGKDTIQDTVIAHLLLLSYLDKDSVKRGGDTVIVSDNYSFPGDSWHKATVFYDRNHLWQELYYASGASFYSFSPFIKVPSSSRIIYNKGSDCALVKGDTLRYIQFPQLSTYCGQYQTGNVLERIGSLFYMFPTDTCKEDSYGGPLLWYEDGEIGRFVVGRDSVMPSICSQEDTIQSNITFSPIQKTLGLSAYPQPFTSHLHLSADDNLNEIRIYDLQGKLMKQYQFLSGSMRTSIDIETGTWGRGIYILKAISSKGAESMKMIKQ